MLKIVLFAAFIILNWFQPILSMVQPNVTVYLTIDNNTDHNLVLHDKEIKPIKVPAKGSATKVTIPMKLHQTRMKPLNLPSINMFTGVENFTLTDTKLNKDFTLSLMEESFDYQGEVLNRLSAHLTLPEKEISVYSPHHITPHYPKEIEYKIHLILDGDNLEKSTIEIVVGSLK